MLAVLFSLVAQGMAITAVECSYGKVPFKDLSEWMLASNGLLAQEKAVSKGKNWTVKDVPFLTNGLLESLRGRDDVLMPVRFGIKNNIEAYITQTPVNRVTGPASQDFNLGKVGPNFQETLQITDAFAKIPKNSQYRFYCYMDRYVMMGIIVKPPAHPVMSIIEVAQLPPAGRLAKFQQLATYMLNFERAGGQFVEPKANEGSRLAAEEMEQFDVSLADLRKMSPARLLQGASGHRAHQKAHRMLATIPYASKTASASFLLAKIQNVESLTAANPRTLEDKAYANPNFKNLMKLVNGNAKDRTSAPSLTSCVELIAKTLTSVKALGL